ncbi:helix-turn-helix domain-containing protein [Dietzia sp. SLG310A2-38A2]|nr:helix-turn-helix domain-containing protein [Dietzia sp. SLG310A2-38A2]
MTTATAAQILGCTPRNVRSLVARGRLTGRRTGGVLLVARDEVEARADRQHQHRRHDHVA